MTVHTSTTVAINVTYRVTVDLDAFTEHYGTRQPAGYEETSLVNHVRHLIEHADLDTPAKFEFVTFDREVDL